MAMDMNNIMRDMRGYVTQDKIDMAIDSCDNIRDRAYIITVSRTGRRPAEVSGLWGFTVSDIMWKENSIAFTILKKRKVKPKRMMPVTDLVLDVLREYLASDPRPSHAKVFPFTTRYGQMIIRKWFDKNNILTESEKPVTPKTLRHSFAINISNAGNLSLADGIKLQRLMQLSTFEMTEHYLRYGQQDLRALVNKAFPDDRRKRGESTDIDTAAAGQDIQPAQGAA